MTFNISFLFAFALSLIKAEASQIKWGETVKTVSLTVVDQKIAEFTFVNQGMDPITIDYVRPECDCITATSNKRIFAPGESGEIGIKQSGRQAIGPKEVAIMVKWHGDGGETERLKVIFKGEAPAVAFPMRVTWKVGEVPTSKIVEIRGGDANSSLLSVVSSSDNYLVSKEDTAQAGMLRAKIEVVDTSRIGQATIRITARIGGLVQVLAVAAGVM